MKAIVLKLYGLFLITFLMMGCNSEANVVSSESGTSLSKYGTSVSNLSKEEIDGLIHMRIEEKLARDVYTVLGDKWNARVFLNIKLSEQTHMDAVKRLLDKHGITDPLTTDEIGVFPDEHFQTLYNELIIRGNLSLKNAFQVGVDIEVLDIEDLNYQLNNVVVSRDIIRVYTNLKNGSENHLKAFNRNLSFLL